MLYYFQDFQGVVAGKKNLKTANWNTHMLNKFFSEKVQPGDSLVFDANKVFYLMGGVIAKNLTDVTIQIDGEIKFLGGIQGRWHWPRSESEETTDPCYVPSASPPVGFAAKYFCLPSSNRVMECMTFQKCTNLKFTSSSRPTVPEDFPKSSLDFGNKGIIDGGGRGWWGLLKYAWYGENRPRMLWLRCCKNVRFENIELRSSPYWTFWADCVDGLEVSYSKIDNTRKSLPMKRKLHNFWQLTAFNTDGFDVKGKNVHIHHVEVINQDDCICCKGGSNMQFENIRASGMGLVIGSLGRDGSRLYQDVGESAVDISFKNCYMDQTDKGIYFKFRGDITDRTKGALIKNVLCENITMVEPSCPIWIGPAQQADSWKFWEGHPASLLWPGFPFVKCNPSKGNFENILLRNIDIQKPDTPSKQGVGVICASPTHPMKNFQFDNVVVSEFAKKACSCICKTNDFYFVGEAGSIVNSIASGNTNPIPLYFSPQDSETTSPAAPPTGVATAAGVHPPNDGEEEDIVSFARLPGSYEAKAGDSGVGHSTNKLTEASKVLASKLENSVQIRTLFCHSEEETWAYRCRCSFQILQEADGYVYAMREQGQPIALNSSTFPIATHRIQSAMKKFMEEILNSGNAPFAHICRGLSSCTFSSAWYDVPEADCIPTLNYDRPLEEEQWREEANEVCQILDVRTVNGRSKGVCLSENAPGTEASDSNIIRDTVYLLIPQNKLDSASIPWNATLDPAVAAGSSANEIAVRYLKPETAFYHPNGSAMTRALEWMLHRLATICQQRQSDRRLLEMYCGCGAHTVALAKTGLLQQVMAVELDPRLVQSCERNIQLNELEALVQVQQGDAGKWAVVESRRNRRREKEASEVSTANDGYQPFDILLVDPPRAGLDEQVCQMALNASNGSFHDFLYISCGHEALLRDLDRLYPTYQVVDCAQMDLFPRTDSIETLVHLRRR